MFVRTSECLFTDHSTASDQNFTYGGLEIYIKIHKANLILASIGPMQTQLWLHETLSQPSSFS
jgi:hypothetical protein